MTEDTANSGWLPAPTSEARWSLRLLLLGVLGLASLIPLLLVGQVANERQQFFFEAVHGLAATWGGEQAVLGPVLIVPVELPPVPQMALRDGELGATTRLRTRHVVLLPDVLRGDVRLTHELRARGIYRIPAYLAAVELAGEFTGIGARVAALTPDGGRVQWSAARLAVGISDPRGIRQAADAGASRQDALRWNGEPWALQPGSQHQLFGAGVQVAVPVSADSATPQRFELQLQLGGTNRFALGALGGMTSLHLRSDWPHPSFDGQHAPRSYDIDDGGVAAEWQVHGLARNLPNGWVHETAPLALDSQQMGMRLHNPVTPYTNVDRGLKYGLLFVALTFLTYLCFELLVGARLHVLQYAVVSLALAMFYLTLLALSEHLAFGLSYALASGLIVVMLAAYTWAMMHSRPMTQALAGVLLLLYGTLYVLLQLEDFALLTGTALLLLGLAALMFTTKSLPRAAA